MTDYARHLVASLVATILPTRGQRLRSRLARQLLPYCAVETDGGHLLLNREYKPIGWPTGLRSRVDYSSFEFDSMRVTPAIGPRDALAAGVHNVRNDDGSFWYFYGCDAGDAPWRSPAAGMAYTRRLQSFLGGRFTDAGVA
jgi:hypothetical protein